MKLIKDYIKIAPKKIQNHQTKIKIYVLRGVF